MSMHAAEWVYTFHLPATVTIYSCRTAQMLHIIKFINLIVML